MSWLTLKYVLNELMIFGHFLIINFVQLIKDRPSIKMNKQLDRTNDILSETFKENASALVMV